MQFNDLTNVPPPPPPVRVPAMPWAVEMHEYGPNKVSRPTKVRVFEGRKLTGEVLDEHGEDMQVWEYVKALEAKVARLQLELELAPLTQREMPPDLAERLATPPTKPNIPPAEPLADLNISPPAEPMQPACAESAPTDTAPCNSPEIPAVAAADDVRPTLRELAEGELLRDPGRSNVKIGELLGCSHEFIRRTRKALEAEGRLQPAVADATG